MSLRNAYTQFRRQAGGILQLPHFVLLALVVIGLSLSFRDDTVPLSLDDILAEGRLVVVTTPGPTTFYLGREGEPAGFEADLARGFARSFPVGEAVEIEFIVKEEIADILDWVQSGRAHIAAAGLTLTAERADEYRFSPPYRSVGQFVVCRKGGEIPASVAELVGVDLVVAEASSYVEALRVQTAGMEGVTWVEDERSPEALLQMVWEEQVGCTVADEPIFEIMRYQHPELVKAFDLTEPKPIAWIVTPGADELATKLDEWMENPKTRQGIERLLAAHFGFFRNFDYMELASFHRDVTDLLPRFERDLRFAARRNDLPWHLLAAMAYQESRWNPDAKSRTGVRGLMMLTQPTAEAVGVEDRTDARASIWGGARYFARLLARVPAGVEGEDRYWFALAAYNIGMGHVFDARTLAARRGLNKNLWSDVKSVLKDLSSPQHYATLKHGRARGYEARQFVERVRTYWHVLEEVR
ncbi:MAG: membrane-bound lytic murein transglycosylase MltF [Parvibaculum sp.]